MQNIPSYRFSVAPMLDWTTRHCRVFHRALSKNALLYTEMITTGAILHGKYDHLFYNKIEQPIALQLGGSSPDELAKCVKIATAYDYQEINLNVGCPSDRVQNGFFGACLMAKPDLVAECVTAMKESTHIPVSVKTRLGIDDFDSYDFLVNFISKVHAGGCNHFIVHARKAWLSGLSPKQNREVPPLMYDRVYQLKRDFPNLTIIINGGLNTLEDAHSQLNHVDGVMLGRAVYQNPMLLLEVDNLFFQTNEVIDKATLTDETIKRVESLYPYIEAELSAGGKISYITRHMVGLFQGVPGSKLWRRYLSENAHVDNAGIEVLETALGFIKSR